MHKPGHKEIALRFTLLFFGVLIPVFLALYFVHHVITENELKQTRQAESATIQSVDGEMTQDFERILADLFILADQFENQIRKTEDGADGVPDELTHLFQSFASRSMLYHQIRYLDKEGTEIVRINHDKGITTVVPEDQLQNKQKRYYFRDSINLAAGEVYVSRFDLNVEDGQVERPYRPVIRFATPLFNSNREPQGIIILNYLADKLLSHLRSFSKQGSQLVMLNSDGFWLFGPDPGHEWGFMFKKKKTFASPYPDAWRVIAAESEGQFQNDSGLFTFATVSSGVSKDALNEGAHIIGIASDSYWKLVSIVDSDALTPMANKRAESMIYIYTIATILWGLFSYMWARLHAISRSSGTRVRLLSQLVDQSNEIVFITDPKGRIEYVNPTFEHVSGYTEDEVLGKSPSILKSGMHDNKFYLKMWNTIRQGKSFETIFINRKKDGALYYAEKVITPLRDAKGKITHFVSTGRDLTEQRELERHIQNLTHMAHHDTLTDIPNRQLFRDRLNHALNTSARNQKMIGLMVIDLDGFKLINDRLGHAIGDNLLQRFTSRVLNLIRKDDTFARIGGDEFCLLVESAGTVENMLYIADKILSAASKPFTLGGEEVTISCSIGLSANKLENKSADTLTHEADQAMYAAKRAGKNRIEVSPECSQLRVRDIG